MPKLSLGDTLAAILDNSPESIVFVSPEHTVLAFNKTIAQLLKEFAGKHLELGADYRNFVLPNDMTLYLQTFERVLKGETVVMQNQTSINEFSTWFEYKMAPVYTIDYELLGITLSAKNIGKQKKAELELEHQAKMYQAIFDNTAEAMILLDADFIVLQYNKTAKNRLFKTIEKSLEIGLDYREFIYEESKETFFNSFEKALKGNKVEKEILASNYFGEPVWFFSRMYPVYDQANKLIGVSVFALDINERKKAELALQESELKFRSIVETSPTPILILDKDKNIVFSNSETEKVFGYSPAELYNKNIKMLAPHRFTRETKKQPTSENLGIRSYRVCNEINNNIIAVTKEGKEIILEVNMNAFKIKGDKFKLVVVQDVTKRVASEKQIQSQIKALKSIAWQQSHEVRRPVANILGLVNLIEMGKNEGYNQQYLDYLRKATEDLDAVIHKIVEQTSIIME